MNKEVIKAIVSHGIRWAHNILTELLSNYGSFIDEQSYRKLREATKLLVDISDRELEIVSLPGKRKEVSQ